jgi:hypothetical protein
MSFSGNELWYLGSSSRQLFAETDAPGYARLGGKPVESHHQAVLIGI